MTEPKRINWETDHFDFKVGDYVTRGGDDVQRITSIADDCGEFLCVVAPASGWCEVGEVEQNLLRRYSRIVFDA